jgi:hypothetical protein
MKILSKSIGYAKYTCTVELDENDQKKTDNEILVEVDGDPCFGGYVERYQDGRATVVVYTD